MEAALRNTGRLGGDAAATIHMALAAAEGHRRMREDGALPLLERPLDRAAFLGDDVVASAAGLRRLGLLAIDKRAVLGVVRGVGDRVLEASAEDEIVGEDERVV